MFVGSTLNIVLTVTKVSHLKGVTSVSLRRGSPAPLSLKLGEEAGEHPPEGLQYMGDADFW